MCVLPSWVFNPPAKGCVLCYYLRCPGCLFPVFFEKVKATFGMRRSSSSLGAARNGLDPDIVGLRLFLQKGRCRTGPGRRSSF